MYQMSSAKAKEKMDTAYLVIKITYGDTLRRFSVPRNDNLELSMHSLRTKILDLFKFVPDADLTLTYIDEDNDVVALVDDNDLRDAIRQRINPLRINVSLNSKGVGDLDPVSSGSYPVKSAQIGSRSGFDEFLKSIPEPLRDAVEKISHDIALKAASSAPLVSKSLKEVFLKFSNDTASKTEISSPGFPELFDLLLSGGGGGSVSQSSDGSTLKDQKVGDDVKALKESVLGDVPANANHVDQTPGSTSNSVGGSMGTFVPDLNEAAKNSDFSAIKSAESSTINNSSSQVLTTIDEKGKTCAGYPKHRPVVPVLSPTSPPFIPTSPSCYSPTSASYTPAVPAVYSPISPSFPPTGPGPFPIDFHIPQVQNRYTNFSDNNMGRIFHKGVRCDGCGVHPITGPRFKSKVKVDYDLCSICYAEMGNDNEYIRIDFPKSYRSRSFKNHPHFRSSSLPHVLQRCPMRFHEQKFDSQFIHDVNIVDGTEMAPTTSFTKIWRMRNNGTITWPRGTRLVWIAGDKLTNVVSVEVEMPVEGCLVEKDLDIALDFTAPEVPGQYVSYWRMALPSGQKFGQCVWVLIQVQVDASQPVALSQRLSDLNLNLPPKCTESKGDLIDMNADFKGHNLIDMNAAPGNHNHSAEYELGVQQQLQPIVGGHSKKIETDLPVNDVVAGNNCDSVIAPLEEPVAVSYPIVDFSSAKEEPTAAAYPIVSGKDEPATVSYPVVGFSSSGDDGGLAPVFHEVVPVVLDVISEPTFSENLNDDNMVEQTLLMELEEMGFMQTDLNREILRRNGYNLEQSVDDLCGVSEWDPMLEELEEMGFTDKETNKKLLIKNGGSIKRVVMDLIAGEKP